MYVTLLDKEGRFFKEVYQESFREYIETAECVDPPLSAVHWDPKTIPPETVTYRKRAFVWSYRDSTNHHYYREID